LDLTGRKSYGDQDREMEGRAMPARVSFAEIAAGLIADSDEVARAFRDEVARRSDMMSPGVRCLAG
jgi:hypothetical protein